MLTLWYSPGSVALAAHIVLEEAGADYALRKLSFKDGDQRSAAYLALNPKGRVPTLETPEGPLTEVLAVMSYVAATHPAANLEPTTPFMRAQLLSFQSYLASTVHVAHAHRVRGARWADDAAAQDSMKAKVTANMTECMALIDSQIPVGPWVMGDHYTTSDPYLFTICTWLASDGVAIAAFPRIAAHFAAMQDRPAVQRALKHHT